MTKSCNGIYKIEGTGDFVETEEYKKLRVVIDTIKKLIRILENENHDSNIKLKSNQIEDCYDDIANSIFQIIFEVSSIKEPLRTCWSIQHNMWDNIFSHCSNGKAWKVIHYRLTRLIYNEVKRLETSPNYKSSRILRVCLNMTGFAYKREHNSIYEGDASLNKFILSWTKKNYLKLIKAHPQVAEECLPKNINFDKKEKRLIKTAINKGLDLEPRKYYLKLEV